jgi:hypothetical protein
LAGFWVDGKERWKGIMKMVWDRRAERFEGEELVGVWDTII